MMKDTCYRSEDYEIICWWLKINKNSNLKIQKTFGSEIDIEQKYF